MFVSSFHVRKAFFTAAGAFAVVASALVLGIGHPSDFAIGQEATAETPVEDTPETDTPETEAAAEETSNDTDGSSEKLASEAAKYAAKLQEWRDVMKDLRDLKVRFQTAKPDETEQMRAPVDELVAKGNSIIPELELAAPGHLFGSAESRSAAHPILNHAGGRRKESRPIRSGSKNRRSLDF